MVRSTKKYMNKNQIIKVIIALLAIASFIFFVINLFTVKEKNIYIEQMQVIEKKEELATGGTYKYYIKVHNETEEYLINVSCPKYLTINKEDIDECQITRTKLKIGLETFQINLI